MPEINATLPQTNTTGSNWINAITALNSSALAWYQTITNKPVYVSPGVQAPAQQQQLGGASQTTSGGPSAGLSQNAIIAIVVAAIALIALVAFGIFRRR